MVRKLDLGLLDIGLLAEYNTSLDTVFQTLNTAVLAEKLGYRRFWISEHQEKDVAWRSTEIMISLLASNTETIRIGSAGVLLNYYNPLLCAQNFKFLNSIFGNRIDLGLAKGKSSDAHIHQLLSADLQLDNQTFNKKLALLKKCYTESFNCTYSLNPYEGTVPELWLLGSSAESLQFAFEQRLNFSLSLCHKSITADLDKRVCAIRKENVDSKKSSNLLVAIICADTMEKARKIATERTYSNLLLSFSGDPLSCKEYLFGLAEAYETSEIIVCDLCIETRDRLRSITLLSEVMELKGLQD